MTTGNYGLTYSDLRLWQYPYLPHFDLLKMHPLTVDIGVPWTAQFFTGKDGWQKPENIVRSIDQFLAATIAYGHIGWLVEEAHGMRQTCRSYYMLQQLQSRYLMEPVAEIRYGTGSRLAGSSEALRTGAWKQNRLYLKYANGLQVWVNGNEQTAWTVAHAGRKYTLPPFGWLAAQGRDFVTASALADDGKRFDRLASPDCVFVDGRGTPRDFDGLGSAGSVAVRAAEGENGLSIVAVDAGDRLVLSAPKGVFGGRDVRTLMARIAAAAQVSLRGYDAAGKLVGERRLSRDAGAPRSGWEIPLLPGAVRSEVRAVQNGR